MAYIGRYTTLADIQTWLDSLNYVVHTDSDRDGDSDAASAEQGHKHGEDRVDLHTGGPYTFTDSGADGTVGGVAAGTFNRWATVLASYDLGSKRGFSGETQENEFIRNRDEVIEEMRQFREGELNLPGAVPATEAEEATQDDARGFEFVEVERDPACLGDEYSSN